MELPLRCIALSWSPFVLLLKIAVAGPVAIPEAAAAPGVLPHLITAPDSVANALLLPDTAPDAQPELHEAAEAGARALPIEDLELRQTYNYYPFSGAIYIVGTNGAAITSAEAAECPAEAPQGCGNINVYNWCCPSGNTCSWLSNSVVGCCPDGSTCGGTVNAAQIETVTVTEYLTTTQYQQVGSTVVEVGGQTTTTVVPGIYVTETQTTTGTSRNNIVYNGYCSTMIANGPNLPTTAQGGCGTILVISAADVRPVGWRLPALIIGFYGLLGLYSFFGFRRRL